MQYGDMHFGELVHPLSPTLFLSNLTHAGKSMKKKYHETLLFFTQ